MTGKRGDEGGRDTGVLSGCLERGGGEVQITILSHVVYI